MRRKARLIYNPGTPDERSHYFEGEVVIGRRKSRGGDGRICVRDAQVSGRHCVVREAVDGRFFVRDVSRNGTRVDGRRLVPNVEVELQPGNKISLTKEHELVLSVEELSAPVPRHDDEDDFGTTQAIENTHTLVTVIVGDITGYTTLTQQKDPQVVYKSVGRVFAALEPVIHAHGGTIKEYQGDAVFAFWEADDAKPMLRAQRACHAALALTEEVLRLASDPDVWSIADFPLRMDWALTSGPVLLSTMGGDRPVGLAMVGDAVNYAFRLEKLADAENPIVLDERTSIMVESAFELRSLGSQKVKGRAAAEPVFSLVSAK